MNEVAFEKLRHRAGLENKYQIIILCLATGFLLNASMITVSLPFLEKTNPILIYNNKTKNYSEILFKYEYCNKTEGNVTNNNSHYEVKEKVHSSWVNEYNIQCDPAKTGLIGSFANFGLLLGSFLYSFFADKSGRRTTILFSTVGCIITLILFWFSNSIYFIYTMIAFLQTFVVMIILGSFTYSAEISSTESRAWYGGIISAGHAIGGVLYTLLFKYMDSWRIIFLIGAGIYVLFFIFYYFFSVESPHYWFAKGKGREIIKCFEYIAKVNGKDLHMREGEILDEETDAMLKKHYATNTSIQLGQENVMDKHGILDMFKYPSIRSTFLIMNLTWFTSTGMYFTILIFLKKWEGDIYLFGCLLAVLDGVSCLFSGWIIETEFFGRKRTLIILSLLSTIGDFGFMFTHDPFIRNILALVVWFGVTGIFNVVLIYSSEVYPTTLRAKGLSINSVFGKLSSIVLPFILEYMEDKIFLIFTVLCSLCSFFLFFIPETYGKEVECEIQEELLECSIQTSLP